MSKPTALSKDFVQRADSAAFFEAWVGAVLSRAGLYTIHHPFTVAETSEQIAQHAHSFDLTVMTELGSNEPGVEVEVKSSNLTFNGLDDYPFESVMVCSQASWQRKWPGRSLTPRDFLFVSRKTGAILWLPIETPVTLGHDVYDTHRDQLYKVVKAEARHLRPLYDFVEDVKEAVASATFGVNW